MKDAQVPEIIKWLIGLFWLWNGLYCKVLNLVPRHEAIVGKILSATHAGTVTCWIGAAEILMAIWIFSGIFSRWNAVLQIVLIATMNILEFFLVPELLLWGKWNALFAMLFIIIIYINEFLIHKTYAPHVPFPEKPPIPR